MRLSRSTQLLGGRSTRLLRALGAASLLVLTCCHTSTSDADEKSGDEKEAPLVQTALIARGTAQELLEVSGTLQALPGQDVKLGALSAGRLLELKKGEGDAVKAGELLGRLDPAPLRAAIEQARALYDEARAQDDNAKLHRDRSARALEAGVAARQEVEDASAALATADAQVRSAKGALAAAENQLQRSELRAPFDGQVAKVFAAQGESLDAGRTVIEVARTHDLELRAAVPADASSRLRAGQRAELLAGPVRASAQVIAVAPVIDAATGAATVRLKIANPDGALKAGQFAKAEVLLAQHDNALLVPRGAIVPSSDGDAGNRASLCIVDKDSRAHCVLVQTRPAQDQEVELLDVPEGIDAGARAIVQGAYALPDGTRVRTQDGAKQEVGIPTVGIKTIGTPTVGTPTDSRADTDSPKPR